MQINVFQTEFLRILAVAERYMIKINGAIGDFCYRFLWIGNIRNFNSVLR